MEPLYRLWMYGWDWEPSVILGCGVLVFLYAYALHFRLSPSALWFSCGVLVLLLALVSPLDTLGDYYLFSAHMLQHLLLVMVVPILLLMGIPPSFLSEPKWLWLRRVERVLRQPVIAWIVGVGTLSVWHLPVLYDATLENGAIHIVEHLLFLASAVIFWAPVVLYDREPQLAPAASLIYLMSSAMAETLLGVVIAYAPTVLYSPYLKPPDPLGILTAVRGVWQISPQDDQEIAGLMMWVPGSFANIAVSFGVIWRWFTVPEVVPILKEPHR